MGALIAVLTTRPACEPFSLEAAEFVGDAVLKYLASVYLHTALRCGGPLLPHTACIPCKSVMCELTLPTLPICLSLSARSSHHESVLSEGRVRLVCNEVLVARAQARGEERGPGGRRRLGGG